MDIGKQQRVIRVEALTVDEEQTERKDTPGTEAATSIGAHAEVGREEKEVADRQS